MSREAERAELHKTIWKIANDLRGSVDGWDFKTYVLGMLFYRFISENLTDYLNAAEREAGNPDFDYATLGRADAELGRQGIVEDKGYFILPEDLFQNVRAKAKTSPNLNETLARVFTNIEASAIGTPSEPDLKGLFEDLDVNSNKLGPTVAKRNEKLAKLLDAIGGLPLGGAFGDNTNDLFGDAYEYLMQMYASNAGKSGGEYYTPQEVAELLARITVAGKSEVNKVYDPACGSASLLLKFAKVLRPGKVRTGFYGQEINLTTYNLARINMFLHDVPYEKFDIAHGDTLTDPAHWGEEPFEAIVSNPPYSIGWPGDSDVTLINDERYAPAGVLAPKSKADLAFIMHILHWLAVDGTAAIVEYPGVLYRGGAEQKIREYLVRNNYVDAVIQLPPDLFFGTMIATCVIVLKKSKTTSDIAFIEASDQFVRPGNKNRLSEANQQTILDALAARTDVDHFVKVVANDLVVANSCKLSASAWVEGVDLRQVVDLSALNQEIAKVTARAEELRAQVSTVLGELDGLMQQSAGEVARKRLGDVGTFVRGNGLLKKDLLEEGSPAIHYGQIFTHYGTVAYETKSFVDPKLAAKAKKAAVGDIVIATTSENDADVGRAVAWLGASPAAVSGDAYIYRHTMDARFVAYFFRSADFQSQKARHVTGTKVRRLSGADMADILIPVPDAKAQREIAERFELLEQLQADLRLALSSEADARRRQFESYRDSVLDFEAASADKG